MIRNFGLPVLNLEGNIIKDEDGSELVLGTAIGRALLATQLPGDNPTPEDKYERYKLAQLIHINREAEVSAEQIALMKRIVGIAYAPVVMGAIWDMLEDA